MVDGGDDGAGPGAGGGAGRIGSFTVPSPQAQGRPLNFRIGSKGGDGGRGNFPAYGRAGGRNLHLVVVEAEQVLVDGLVVVAEAVVPLVLFAMVFFLYLPVVAAEAVEVLTE